MMVPVSEAIKSFVILFDSSAKSSVLTVGDEVAIILSGNDLEALAEV